MKATTYAPIEVFDAIDTARKPASSATSTLSRLIARWTSVTSAGAAGVVDEELAALDDHLLRDIGVLDGAHARRGH